MTPVPARVQILVALACLLAVPPLTADRPAASDRPAPVSGYAIHHDTSPPLRSMRFEPAQPTGFAMEVPIRVSPGTPRTPRMPIAPDGGLQSSLFPMAGLGPTPAPIISFDGLSDDDNAALLGFRLVPPDTNGDIGLDDAGNLVYVQYINVIWNFYDATTGAALAAPMPGNTFWSGFGGFCEANNNGDPVVLYDDQAGRWVFSQFSPGQGIQCVAVSTTSDPLGPYHRYAFVVTPGGFNDYPKMGVWDDGTSGSTGQSAYTFTTRDFGVAGFIGSGVMERDAMLVGAPAQFIKFQNPCVVTDCIEGQLPPHLAGPPPAAGTCPTFWSAYDSAYDFGSFAVDGYRNHTLCVDWSNLLNSTYAEGAFVTAGSNFDRFLGNGFSDCISPVNGGEVLDCLAAFTMYRAQYRWTGRNASVVLNTTVDADGTDRAGIRWAETQSVDGMSGWTLAQDGTYAPTDGLERWMGSIAQDWSGDMALGYSVTSDSLFPSVRYTSRMAGDPPGIMSGGEASCVEGTGAQIASANRWGDYSSMSVDPTDDCTFWYTQEYYQVTGSFDFNTRICSFKLDNCGTIAIDVKFCSNPNGFNCKKKGRTPVTIFGTAVLDVNNIDVGSLRLCLASDPTLCTSAPEDWSIADRGDPTTDLGASMCAINPTTGEEENFLNPDGFDDLDAVFDSQEVSALIDCASLGKGGISESLVVTGQTLAGQPFTSVAVGDVGIDQLMIKNK